MCDSPVILPSNRQTSNILTEHIMKVVANFISNNVPSKISQNIDILARIYGNVSMATDTHCHKSIFK